MKFLKYPCILLYGTNQFNVVHILITSKFYVLNLVIILGSECFYDHPPHAWKGTDFVA